MVNSMKYDMEVRRGIRRVARRKVLLNMEKELASQGRAIQTDYSPATKKYMKLIAAIAVGGAAGIFAVTTVYLIFVWLLHLQLNFS